MLVSFPLAFFGAVGLVWFLIPAATKGILNIGNLTGMCVCACLLILGIFYRGFAGWMHAAKRTKAGRVVIFSVCVFVLACVTAGVLMSGFMVAAANRAPDGDTTLIVLGCRVYGERPSLTLRERMDAAYDYLDTHPNTDAVLSGGTGEGEDISEAACMYRYLTEKGIDADRLYLEDQSTSTRENIAYSMEIVRGNGLTEAVTIVTNEFHQFRAMRIAKELGTESYAVSGETAWWLLPTFWVREWYGILQQIFL